MPDDDFQCLAELHRAITNAAEVIAAFISVVKSGETPRGDLVAAAEEALTNLVARRAQLGDGIDRKENLH